ncbi:hypothetical protein NBRC3257_1439 [Gluconobacter thailandicus NBRC 3257]|uniref:Uncharacterized protein n=1 Tax=Gluconobacter thailandicus NBRC 3257 TaxID=1381097 RepID=A0ABQ0IW58_GLUTH|nr:hypothetical protein NBRC3257_1439 [Gluconobacter thailandicus NBRC 3257]
MRTREEIETELQRLFTHGVRGPNAAWQIVHRIFDEVRDYGAEEQRRKDVEGQKPVAWLIEDKSKGVPGKAFTEDRAVTCKGDADYFVRFNFSAQPLFAHSANVAALEAEIAELKEAERLARADAEANKARVSVLLDHLKRAEYASRKDSLTPIERLESVQAILRVALSREVQS